jgi:RNA polymerase sigma-70 factor (ECF subfamily)
VTPTTSVPAGFDESVLVAQAKAGDQNAFSELVNRYERKIYRLAKNITRNDEDAEDVLQDAFLKAYTHLDNFKGDSKFYTWIVRIAVNEALMRLRKRKTDRSVLLDEAVDSLKPDFRTVFVLRDIEELSTEETAETLGISVPAVKSRLLRARLALRERLTRQFKRKGEDLLGYL